MCILLMYCFSEMFAPSLTDDSTKPQRVLDISKKNQGKKDYFLKELRYELT